MISIPARISIHKPRCISSCFGPSCPYDAVQVFLGVFEQQPVFRPRKVSGGAEEKKEQLVS